MAEVAARRSVDEVLQLALDTCLGLGAFWVKPTGAVDVVVSNAAPLDDGVHRIEHLARNTLSHPAASGREVFWNAEVSTESELADRSLACVVVPSWQGDAPAGFLGVVDVWLPEPDDAQLAALRCLAAHLGSPDGEVHGGGVGADPGGKGDVARPLAHARLGLFAPGAPWDEQGAAWGKPPGGRGGSGGEGFGGQGLGVREAATLEQWTGGRSVGDDDALALDVLRHLPEAVVVTRRDGTIVFANDRFATMVGRGGQELCGANVQTMVAPDRAAAPVALGGGGADRQRPFARRLTVVGPSGDERPATAVDVRLERPGDGGGEDRFVTVLRPAPFGDGSAAAAHIDCVDLIGNLDDGVLCLDATGTVVLSNRAADQFHGAHTERTLVGSPLPALRGFCTEDGEPLAVDAHPGMVALRDGAACTARLVLGGEGRGQQHVTVTGRPFAIDGQPGALVVFHNSTTEWLEQQRLTQYALYDPLTGLANRYLLLEELRRMLLLLGRQGGAVALVYLDLDGFKRINDEHGHDMGDEVLAAVARRLRGAVRSDDVVARLGGDEFVIAHAATERLPDGDLVVSRLRKVLSAPFRVRSLVFDVGASIGWVSTDRGEEGPEALLAKADRAMYLQKRNRVAARRGAN